MRTMTPTRTLPRSTLVAVLGFALAALVACSGDGSGGGTGNGTGGGTGGGKDAGSADAADASGGTKANGETCTADGDCASAHCKAQGTGGGGGGTAGSFCTVFCATPQQTPAPECAAAVFTGKCSGMSFCQVK